MYNHRSIQQALQKKNEFFNPTTFALVNKIVNQTP
jgi:hypothetical protein